MHDENTERFDPEVLRQLTSGDQEIMTVVVSAFLSQYPEHLANLRTACIAGNSSQVLFSAHSLKGMATQLGAAKLRKLAAGIEKLAKEGASPTALLSLTDALAQEYAELTKLLARLH